MQSSNHNGHRPLAATNGNSAPPHVRSPGESLIVGWPIMRIWCLAFAISTAIAAADAILGHHVILIGLLIVGPCCGLLTGRWIHTATVGAWTVALAVALGVPDRIWGSWTHLAFLAAVTIVAVVSAASAALIDFAANESTIPWCVLDGRLTKTLGFAIRAALPCSAQHDALARSLADSHATSSASIPGRPPPGRHHDPAKALLLEQKR